MKHNQFQAPFIYESGTGLFRELFGLLQERDTIGSPSITLFLRTAPSTKENSTACTEQMLFNIMLLHEHTLATNQRGGKRTKSHGSSA